MLLSCVSVSLCVLSKRNLTVQRHKKTFVLRRKWKLNTACQQPAFLMFLIGSVQTWSSSSSLCCGYLFDVFIHVRTQFTAMFISLYQSHVCQSHL